MGTSAISPLFPVRGTLHLQRPLQAVFQQQYPFVYCLSRQQGLFVRCLSRQHSRFVFVHAQHAPLKMCIAGHSYRC